MSDPAKQTEIEDVLSSILRLVSDDREPPAGPPEQKLLLTPSLRVAAEPGTEAGAQEVAGQPEERSSLLAATAAAIEVALSQGDDAEWEPDDAGANLRARINFGTTPEDDSRAAQALGGTGDAVPEIDPDALRPLVAEMLREELRGALGERITRTVRKLVQQEVHRILTARGLD
ncbi:hypothetical protein [Pontibaca methylaminivorans]|uniref:Uncharacterized protein n=1 Tax=Pontibaca methylaminivorans TaxID=515897 RepID=A0A1R3WWA3_9RHOB|nr:hypothetical protein [Pontibaca methylaminivorans]SIT81941.1 hypothetical protein SAMN05421849_1583 [Pontibaca methylaminivorans]